jgi:predicted RNase H-like nuclease (RuvC/YqgF family)
MARGYMKYKNSDLYKEIVSNNKEKNNNDTQDKPKKKVTQTDNIFISINKKDYTELKNDVKEMKTEIKELRKTLTELVEMMKAVYEFEDS